MSRSDYEVVGVVIVDLNLGNKSVTNDAEAVVAELADRGRILSFDSQGYVDELDHDHGLFKGFKPVNAGACGCGRPLSIGTCSVCDREVERD